jgi:hypothetical protein
MYDQIISELISSKAVKATHYQAAGKIVRAKRTTFKKNFGRGNIEITITIGKPNYLERQLAKRIKDHGGTFPTTVYHFYDKQKALRAFTHPYKHSATV